MLMSIAALKFMSYEKMKLSLVKEEHTNHELGMLKAIIESLNICNYRYD